MRRIVRVGLVAIGVVALAGSTTACEPAVVPPAPAPWTIRAGVETITLVGADPGQPLTLLRGGRRLITLEADEFGQAHFAYIPRRHVRVASGSGTSFPEVAGGRSLDAGRYTIRDETRFPTPVTPPITVLGRDDVPDVAHYERQELTGARLDVLGNVAPGSSLEDGFNYIETRDGVMLSTMVRFPDQSLYGPGPYPTVVEYSGYGPSNPASEEPGVRIARALGYATVAVNLRGTGCSGGVFDVFNPAQMADGYDVIETVARQPWVQHGHVGMVGLSYSGITQLYTAATRPPSLAAIIPQSVIRDSWEQAWPGGIFNSGFTREWLDERDRQASPGGTSWVQARIDAGDATCGGHMQLRNQNPDFEALVRALAQRPADADDRSLPLLVPSIDVPVYLTGAFQDEQTGPQFTTMIDQFTSAPVLRVGLWNGRHPDGYGPQNLNRWFEFLELYVARRVPVMNPLLRLVLPGIVGPTFGFRDVTVEGDRFTRFGTDHAAALAAYEAEAPVRVLFESGAGRNEPGEHGGTFERSFSTWPPAESQVRTWFLGDAGTLAEQAPAGPPAGVDSYRYDPGSGSIDLFPAGGYPLFDPTWGGAVWGQYLEGKILSYLTPAMAADTVFGGPGRADLHVAVDATDAMVMVSVSEVRPDGREVLIQNGVQRLGYAVDEAATDGLEVAHNYARYRPVRPGRVQLVSVEIPSFNHVLRAGSQLRVTVTTPGRNFAAWAFEQPGFGREVTYQVFRQEGRASAVSLTVLPDIDVPDSAGLPPCPSLRGQVCRPYEPRSNTTTR